MLRKQKVIQKSNLKKGGVSRIMKEITIQYDSKEFGKRLKRIRKRMNITQEQLAEKLNLSVDSVSNFETGKTTCMPDHLIKICQLFNISADYFFFDKDFPLQLEENVVMNKIKQQLITCSDFDLYKINKIIQIMLLEPEA